MTEVMHAEQLKQKADQLADMISIRDERIESREQRFSDLCYAMGVCPGCLTGILDSLQESALSTPHQIATALWLGVLIGKEVGQ